MADGEAPEEPGAALTEAVKDNQAFWTLAVGAPALLSVLRLWVEAGGELQTTLLLVENVDPINLIAALVATASWLVATGFVAVFSIGGVLVASGGTGSPFARWSIHAPAWMRAGAFLLAAATWEILYLPLLGLAWCAAYQMAPRRLAGLTVSALVLGGYTVLVWPTIAAAWSAREVLVVVMLTLPPVLALFIAGPVRPRVRPLVSVVGHVMAGALLLWAAVPFVTTPVLPLTVLVVADPAADTPIYLRGHVVATDDVNTVVLAEQGGVSYVPNGRIQEQFLCPREEELPRYDLHVHGYRLEDSVLRAIGRTVRPMLDVSPACRVAPVPDV